MASDNDDYFRIIMPDDQKAAFLAALAIAAQEENATAPVFDEEKVPRAEAKALKFDPVSLAGFGLVALKFVGTAVAGHLICKTFDALIINRLKKSHIIVIDPQGRKFEVKAENLSMLQQVLVRAPKS